MQFFLKIFLLGIIFLFLGFYFREPVKNELHHRFGWFSGSVDVDLSLVLPKKMGVFDYQFKGPAGLFVLVVQDKVSVYQDASRQSAVLHQLRFSQRVRVVFKKKVGSDKWFFIQNESGKTNLGWVRSTQVGFNNQFSVIEPGVIRSFRYTRPGYEADFQVDDQGFFLVRWSSHDSGLSLQGTDKGRLYRFNQVIYAKRPGSDFVVEFFCLDAKGALYSEYKYSDGEVIALQK